MRNRTAQLLLSLAAVCVFAVSASAQAEQWKNDVAHSGAYFQVFHMKVSNVRGSFHKMSVTMMYDPADVTKTTIDTTIDAASIDTDVAARDEDLRGPNYFDVAKYPTLTFKSERVAAVGGGKAQVTGDLTIHGVTKQVTLDVSAPTAVVKDAKGNSHMGFTATTTINRKDFGITINPNISDDVKITLEMDMFKPGAPLTSSNRQQ